MTSITPTPDFLKAYIHEGLKHEAYSETVELYESVQVHADGEFPEELIGNRRPSESKLTFDYRKEIFESQTKQPFSKIFNSLAKVRKSQDWSIKHPESAKKIKQGESLKDYCESRFPFYDSVTTWFFSMGLKNYLVDPNAILLIYPKEIPLNATEYLKPICTIFNSDLVLDYKENDYAVFKSNTKNYFVENGQKYEGDIHLLVTDKDIFIAKQIKVDGTYTFELLYNHNLGYLPCRQLRAVFYEEEENGYLIYKSRLDGCVASWNEAAREYSDLQASVVKHMFPTMVIHTNSKCNSCSGVGKIQKNGELIECSSCKGKGSVPTSPYEDIEVRPSKAGEQPLPSPVAYYIQKDTNIITIQDGRIQKHIDKAYGAINFDFLAGLNQSGVAKELDRSELNAFVYDIAEDIVSILDFVYKVICDYRYFNVLVEEERRAQLPMINVPEKYDIVSETYLVDEITKAKANKMNPFIVNELEVEYANKKFNTNPTVKEMVKLSVELDPLAGLSEDEKSVKLSNQVILKEDYIVSSYIVQFIRRAIAENKDFMNLEFSKQLEILRGYAKEIVNMSSQSNKIQNDIIATDNAAQQSLNG